MSKCENVNITFFVAIATDHLYNVKLSSLFQTNYLIVMEFIIVYFNFAMKIFKNALRLKNSQVLEIRRKNLINKNI